MPVGSVIATVASISGSAYVRALDGSTRPLSAGDAVLEGEIVVTETAMCMNSSKSMEKTSMVGLSAACFFLHPFASRLNISLTILSSSE